ncbi:hypothetical protein EG327_007074 [Venturia inaequalis]|uniref:Heterokaryon incompatibility domain-containing protein n=1 Tax=Venturia inaequalis TaxID=5025 RepID=A0A8H3Z4B0_VENIN|nr:hypothetical protein EG327_007074 [Venturia inaequalis]
MRLINVKTGILEEFWGGKKPKYAILSHTWGPEEVTFTQVQQFSALKDGQAVYETQAVHLPGFATPQASLVQRSIESKAGYTKIKMACQQAGKDGFQYIWIDTCCIDKSSSAELSEAINSMYDWYRDAEIAYAYLEDVQNKDDKEALATSRWFTRGWCLQELLAPKQIIFFGKDWLYLGTKDTLVKKISDITGITSDSLFGHYTMQVEPIAKKMAWASKRNTTRVEDMAYCLLGIFNVHMPLLYGEGHGAFQRLQEEIIKSSSDETIFAWHEGLDSKYPRSRSSSVGILASSPRNFADSKNVEISMIREGRTEIVTPYMITNRGLQMELQLMPYQPPPGVHGFSSNRERDLFVGVLQCTSGALLGGREDRFGILLWRHTSKPLYYRWRYEGMDITSVQQVDANGLHKIPKQQIFLAIR